MLQVMILAHIYLVTKYQSLFQNTSVYTKLFCRKCYMSTLLNKIKNSNSQSHEMIMLTFKLYKQITLIIYKIPFKFDPHHNNDNSYC